MQEGEMDQLRRVLEAMEQSRIQGDEKLAKSINEMVFHVNRFGHASALQQKKEILSFIYQKASGYTNLVMVGGYASAFGIWQLTKANITSDQSMIVGALIICSVILFAGFEVYKMITHAVFFRRLNRVLEESMAEAERDNAWQMAWDSYAASESRMWVIFLAPTVLTGFGAGFYLLWLFSMNLAKSI
jgi:hypothetical protein